MVKVSDLLRYAARHIHPADARVLLAHIMGMKAHELVLYRDEEVVGSVNENFKKLVNIRKTGYPIAYITGEKEFFSLPFKVTPDVLIPRPDTEILVEWGISHARGRRVLDLCCGSGCIGISVGYYEKSAKITLADISEGALEVASQNAAMNNVFVNFMKIDILEDEILGEYDLVLSNPPYIESAEIPTLEPDVCVFEPSIALDGGDSGLVFYPKIIKKAYHALSSGGLLGLEVGHTQAGAVSKMMKGYFRDVEVLQDLGGHERVVTGRCVK